MPETARARTSVVVKPVLAALQLVPLLVERKTPAPVPGKRLMPETARARTSVVVKPVLAAFQLVPLLVEMKTMPREPEIPAKRFVPETARHKGTYTDA
jgi:hypothetical protein